ncbi:MAG: universal stress protein [Haloferacaceae archaeon]
MSTETFTRILVPTDGSKASRRAAAHAVELAKQSGAEIHAMYVMDMGDVDFVATPDDIAETRRRMEKKGRGFVDRVAEMAGEGDVECVTVVKSGIPEDEILEYAHENAVDLISMGKRGRSDPDKLLIGSTTQRVVARSDVPVHTS